MASQPTIRMPTLFISHGGGPAFFLDLKGTPFVDMDKNSKLAEEYRRLAQHYPKPKAVLVVSAHWEEAIPTVQTTASPSLYFDYYGFPKEAYELTWPAPGSPALAQRVRGLLKDAGIQSAENSKRGFDHGVFVPLKLAFPDADVPTFQLSLQSSLDPTLHLRIGQALAPLRDEGVLIIGSGSSTHNLGAPRSASNGKALPWAAGFQTWLDETLMRSTSEETVRRLIHMDAAPHFRMAHPREEHLTPLLVAVGAANPDVQLGATKTSAATPVAAGAEVQVDATGSASAVAGKQAGRARLLFQGLMMGQPIESFAFD